MPAPSQRLRSRAMERAILKDTVAAAVDEAAGAERADDWPIRPALFARYGDIDALRHDYPLVLIRGETKGRCFRPLMRIVNDALAASAPRGSEGEAMRQNVLRLEAAIRRRVSGGERGRLSELWRSAAHDQLEASGEAPFGPMDSDFDHVREALEVDGALIPCDAVTPRAVLRHVWKAVHRERARAFRRKVDALVLGLTDILKADYAKSEEAHQAERLRDTMGASDADLLDFHALSRILVRQHPEERLPPDRKRRIEWALLVLTSQRFYGPGRASERKPGQPEPHHYIFDSCSEALDAFRARLPEVLQFVKALTVAELEAQNRYEPAVHDPIIDAFDESDLTEEQLSLMPAPLVCLHDGQSGNAELVRAFEALVSGLPFKVLIQTDDILGATTPEPPRDRFGGGSARLAAMAMGLTNTFAMQVSAAHLYGMGERLERGMHHAGPALFCIYSGATPTVPDVPPYLLAAAATESRAFPSFAYDPSAGPDWARRFDLSGNPQPEADWPAHPLDFEDGLGQRQHMDTRFSVADFAMCDSRYRRFCRPLKTGEEGDDPVPVAEWLNLPGQAREAAVPFAPGLDPDNRLYRIALDEKVVARARSAQEAWRSLRELAGIGNSHVERALAEARAAAQQEAMPEPAAAPPAEPSPPPPAAAPEAEAAAVQAETAAAPEPSAAPADDGLPWIETARCTTCNECTQINAAMFAYNEDGQAFIKDPRAGSFRELVEAAESCQVSIIHPGKPLNPDEPDLDALMERAAEFN